MNNLATNIAQRQAAADDFAAGLAGVLTDMQVRGLSQRAMVAELNALDIRTSRGGTWRLMQLQRTLTRLRDHT